MSLEIGPIALCQSYPTEWRDSSYAAAACGPPHAPDRHRVDPPEETEGALGEIRIR